MKPRLSHVDAKGKVRMVDVSDKLVTSRLNAGEERRRLAVDGAKSDGVAAS